MPFPLLALAISSAASSAGGGGSIATSEGTPRPTIQPPPIIGMNQLPLASINQPTVSLFEPRPDEPKFLGPANLQTLNTRGLDLNQLGPQTASQDQFFRQLVPLLAAQRGFQGFRTF